MQGKLLFLRQNELFPLNIMVSISLKHHGQYFP